MALDSETERLSLRHVLGQVRPSGLPLTLTPPPGEFGLKDQDLERQEWDLEDILPLSSPLAVCNNKCSSFGIMPPSNPSLALSCPIAFAASQANDENLVPGILLVTYDEKGGALVRWAVDVQQLRRQRRCGLSRRFVLRFRDQEVAFLFIVAPELGPEASAPTFVRRRGRGSANGFGLAVMQLKCIEVSALPAWTTRVGVAFAAGCMEGRRQVGDGLEHYHDFTVDPLCALASHEASWDLAAATMGPGESTSCVVSASIVPGRLSAQDLKQQAGGAGTGNLQYQ